MIRYFLISLFLLTMTQQAWAVQSNEDTDTDSEESVIVNDSSPSEATKWDDAGFGNTKIQVFKVKHPKRNKKGKTITYTHKFSPTFVLFRGTKWTKKDLKSRAQQIAKVYSQCGIKVHKPKIIITDPLNGQIDVSFKKETEAIIANKVPTLKRPILFYVQADIDASAAYAIRGYDVKTQPNSNTAWITEETKDQKSYNRKKRRPKGYSVDAHELAHILANTKHNASKEKNILSRKGTLRTNDIPEWLCKDVRAKTKLVTKL